MISLLVRFPVIRHMLSKNLNATKPFKLPHLVPPGKVCPDDHKVGTLADSNKNSSWGFVGFLDVSRIGSKSSVICGRDPPPYSFRQDIQVQHYNLLYRAWRRFILEKLSCEAQHDPVFHENWTAFTLYKPL